MLRRSNGRSVVTACACIATLLVGCSSDASTSVGTGTDSSTTLASDGSSTTSAGETTVPATTSPTATTAATVPAGPTTTAPEELVLRYDGLGPFDFGSASGAVIDAITAQLGAPARNNVVLYVDTAPLGDGIYEGPAPNFDYWGSPVGLTTCWTGDFCVYFGGETEGSQRFEGWTYSGPPHMLASSSNLTISAQWADFPSMIVHARCYRDGGGTHHDILLNLEVDGGWDWLVPDAGGVYVENLPDPEYTRVTYMWAGAFPNNGEGDC